MLTPIELAAKLRALGTGDSEDFALFELVDQNLPTILAALDASQSAPAVLSGSGTLKPEEALKAELEAERNKAAVLRVLLRTIKVALLDHEGAPPVLSKAQRDWFRARIEEALES